MQLKFVGEVRPNNTTAVGAMARTLITSRRLLPDVAWDQVMKAAWPTPKGD